MVTPMFSVLTRTSGRPRFFEHCRRSVLMQQEPVFHLVYCDNAADDYPAGDLVLRRPAPRVFTRQENLYFNTMVEHVPESHPWIIYLDDDDIFTQPDALRTLRRALTDAGGHDDILLMWKMRRLDHTIPDRVGGAPRFGNITGGAICHHRRHFTPWEARHGGDFQVINTLYGRLHPVWIDMELTAMQAGPGMGNRGDL